MDFKNSKRKLLFAGGAVVALPLFFQFLPESDLERNREVLCKQDVQLEIGAADRIPFTVKDGAEGNKYFRLELHAINGIPTVWQVSTSPPLAMDGQIFSATPGNPVMLETVSIQAEGQLTIRRGFSAANLSDEQMAELHADSPFGMYPVEGWSMISQTQDSSLFGTRTHTGPTEEYAVDIGARRGANVLAFDDGIVVWKEDGFGDFGCGYTDYLPRGNSVRILHPDGLESTYLHVQNGSVSVEPGQAVMKGDVIAKVGNSGNARGPHLHFQLGGMTHEGLRTVPVRFQTFSAQESFAPKAYKWTVNGGAVIPSAGTP